MGARSRTTLSRGLAIGLQQFSEALARAIERKQDREERAEQRKAMAAEREESRALREREFQAGEQHRRETEKRLVDDEAKKGTGGSTSAPERQMETILFNEFDKRGTNVDVDELWERMQKRPKMKVGDTPAVMQATIFKGKGKDEMVDVGDRELRDAEVALAEGTNIGNLMPGDASRDMAAFRKTKKTMAEKLNLTGPDELEALVGRYREKWDQSRRAKKPQDLTQDVPEAGGVGVESGAPQPQEPWGGMPQTQVPDSKDGRVADYRNDLMAKRLSRDPGQALVAGHELRKLGYPTPVSPFDAIDPNTGVPSPELLQAAQNDPELLGLIQQYQQMQTGIMQSMPGQGGSVSQPRQPMQPGAQTQQSGPGQEPMQGRPPSRPPSGTGPAAMQGAKRPKVPGDVERMFDAEKLGQPYRKGTTVRRR